MYRQEKQTASGNISLIEMDKKEEVRQQHTIPERERSARCKKHDITES